MTDRYYEVIDAGSEHDAYPPTPRRISARAHPGREWATDAEDAACQWAEDVWHHYDYPSEMQAIVTDPDGVRWMVAVTVEAVPAFHGHASRCAP